jgi:hypothetical protein
MIKVSAAKFLGWTSLIVILPTTRPWLVGQHICGDPNRCRSIRCVTKWPSSACSNSHLARAIRKSRAIDDDRWRRTASPHRSETGTFVEAGGTAAEGIPIQLVSQLITMIPSSGCLTWRRLNTDDIMTGQQLHARVGLDPRQQGNRARDIPCNMSARCALMIDSLVTHASFISPLLGCYLSCRFQLATSGLNLFRFKCAACCSLGRGANLWPTNLWTVVHVEKQ